MAIDIAQFPCLGDNYGYLVHDRASGETAAVDTPDADVICDTLDARGWKLTQIWNTHHHFDHTGGNLDLAEKTGCTIVGPAGEAERIPGLDRPLNEGDLVELGATTAQILEVGGHTHGHIAYHLAEAHAVFVGDSLFALGCGRLFEGTPEQMWESLQKLARLPEDTHVYCAHEYTAANAAFAVTIDPDNTALTARHADITAARAAGKPTVPPQIGLELATNPFLRPADAGIRKVLGMPDAADVEVFAEIRRRKDNF